MTTFLFAAVAVSGIRIISTVPFTRRNRFILTASLAVGYGATLVPKWFDYVFTYEGDNGSLKGFMNAISLVMETGFAVTAFLALFLNLFLPEEIEDDVVDVDGRETDADNNTTGATAPAKTIGTESSRHSDVDSVDKIEQHPNKEANP
jgi:uric acid-xanthine permease